MPGFFYQAGNIPVSLPYYPCIKDDILTIIHRKRGTGMKRKTIFVIIVSLVVIAQFWGCSNRSIDTDSADTIVLQSTQSECLNGFTEPPGRIVESYGHVSFYAGHDTVIVGHDSTYYNCGSHLAVFLEQDDLELNFSEVDTFMTPMRCMCYFDVQAVAGGLSTGVYTVRLWQGDTGELLAEEELFVPGK